MGIFSTGLCSDFGRRCHADSRGTEEAKPALEPNWHKVKIEKNRPISRILFSYCFHNNETITIHLDLQFLPNGTADKLLIVTLYLSGKRYGACMATVNFYAAARAASGLSVSEFEGQTLAEVIAAASKKFPKLEQILPGCSYLINGSATLNLDIKVNPSDVIDVLPRFAGGS